MSTVSAIGEASPKRRAISRFRVGGNNEDKRRSVLSFAVLSLSGINLPVGDVLGVLTLPSVLLNMLLAIPVYAVMRDLARWVYPSPEVE